MFSSPKLHAAVKFPNQRLETHSKSCNILSRIDLSYKTICALRSQQKKYSYSHIILFTYSHSCRAEKQHIMSKEKYFKNIFIKSYF